MFLCRAAAKKREVRDDVVYRELKPGDRDTELKTICETSSTSTKRKDNAITIPSQFSTD